MEYMGHRDQQYGHISYAQHGDDIMLVNIFSLLDIEYPSYVDIGAHHPLHISNTALLYKRGSRGVCVEANPNLMPSFRALRSEDTIVNVGIGIKSGALPFYMYDNKSGLNSFKASTLEKVENIITVDVITINELLEKYCGGKCPDLICTDIEGLDMDVLRTLDYNKYRPKVICTEVRRHESIEFCRIMYEFGYVAYCRMGENLIFVHYQLSSKLY